MSTAPILPGGTLGQSPSPDETTKKLIEMLTRSAQTPQIAAKPNPMPVPGRVDPNAARQIGMNTANPHGWGFERFAAGVAGDVRNAVAAQKEKQVSQATADWEYLKEAGDELEAAKASGDQNAIKAAQSKVQAVLGDPKKVKRMQKALQMSWLDPSKTDAYTEGLNRMMKQAKEEEQKKRTAAQGIKRVFQAMKDKIAPQEPKLTPEEQSKMSSELYAKIPMTRTGSDAKTQLETARTVLDIEKAAHEARQKYKIVPGQDGRMWAVNDADPKDSHVLRDAENGDEISGKQTGKQGVMQSNGVPVGVYHNGKPVLPGDADWTEHDQKLYEGAVDAGKEKQLLRIDPIISAELGAPPDPKDFAKGRSDPAYNDALKKYGKEAEDIKGRMAAVGGAARAKAFNEYRPVQVMDSDGNVYYTTAKAAIEQGQSGAGEGIKLKPREAQIKDIQVASKSTRDAINKLDRPFSTAQVAKLHYAMATEDPTLANEELSTLATQDLTEKQQDFVIWVRQLNERAMSLRNVAGMGTGAQDLRTAIRQMIPGIRSGDKKMMNKQLDAFDNQVSILKTGIAHPGKKDTKKDPLGILD
jgi:hypothetical protein